AFSWAGWAEHRTPANRAERPGCPWSPRGHQLKCLHDVFLACEKDWPAPEALGPDLGLGVHLGRMSLGALDRVGCVPVHRPSLSGHTFGTPSTFVKLLGA